MAGLSSMVGAVERFLAQAGFDRAPWLAVAFGAGISAWFVLPGRSLWAAFIVGALLIALAAIVSRPARETRYPYLRQAVAAVALALAAGAGLIWFKSAMVGTPGIARPVTGQFTGLVLSREERVAEQRVRLIVAIRDPAGADRVIKVRIVVPATKDNPLAAEGARVSVRARLMPPAHPMVPGGYDFARTAWFQGLAATGSALAPPQVLAAAPPGGGGMGGIRQRLSDHVTSRLTGSQGGIAAAFASGDRGGISEGDEAAMRDSGLTHLLSVSGLHVSAVVGAVYVLAIRILALWPWLALRVRLPVAAAGAGALAGLAYTLLTGAEVPTVRSLAGAVLVLLAVALGRDALSLRLLAVAGFVVMLLWPEAVVGASFQLSFGAVLAIVAVHSSERMKRFLAHRDEGWPIRAGRKLVSLLITGMAIELALMPIGLFHFHRAGVYGALANIIAIPLTTAITMPALAIALLLDIANAGAPAWWVTGLSIRVLLGLAHLVAAQPGAVTMFPAMGAVPFSLFLAGGLWLVLWQSRIRLWGVLPLAIGTGWLATLQPPDVLVSGDGRHVAFPRVMLGQMVMLRDTRSDFARDTLAEVAGQDGSHRLLLQDWSGAQCNPDFCLVTLRSQGRDWRFLMARGRESVPLRDLAAACERVDVVIADRRLPMSCRPRVLKADRATLDQTGGLSFDLARAAITTVAQTQGEHGWWVVPATETQRRSNAAKEAPAHKTVLAPTPPINLPENGAYPVRASPANQQPLERR